MKPVGAAVAAIGAGDAAMIERSAPPRAGNRSHHVVMMRRRPAPAVRQLEIMMFGRMRMAGEADGETPALEKREELVAVDQIGAGVVGIEIVAQRDMHHQHYELFPRRLREDVANEFELIGVDAPL